MWDETLIESKGKRNNGRRWLTVQVAAIVHGGIVAILAAASFWYADGMTLPLQSQPIATSVFIERRPDPPALKGIQKHTENPVSNNSQPVQQVTQQNIVAEDENVVESSAPFTDSNNLGDLPVGDPDGVDFGVKNGSGKGGFGQFGDGIGTAVPIPQDQFKRLRIQQPEVIHRVEPVYPSILLRAHKQGVVILQALITANGDVEKIEILRSDQPLFAQTAINAVSQWKYRPAKLDGKSVAVYFTVTVMFHIR